MLHLESAGYQKADHLKWFLALEVMYGKDILCLIPISNLDHRIKVLPNKRGKIFFQFFHFFQPIFGECDKKWQHGQTEMITFK